jgi:hypothetical protein
LILEWKSPHLDNQYSLSICGKCD